MYWCPDIVVFEEKNDYYDDDDYRLVTRNFNWHPNANCTLQLVKQICISQLQLHVATLPNPLWIVNSQVTSKQFEAISKKLF